MGNAQQTSGDAIYGARHVGAESGSSHRGAGADREPAVRLGHAVGRDRCADDSTRRVEDRAGRRHGIDVASAARDSRHALGRRAGRRQAGGFAHGGAARQLLRPVHGQHRRALRRAAGRHARDAGRVRAALAEAGRRGLQGWTPSGRDNAGPAAQSQGRAHRRDVHRGRPSASGDDDGEPGQVEAVVRQERHRSPPAMPAESWMAARRLW